MIFAVLGVIYGLCSLSIFLEDKGSEGKLDILRKNVGNGVSKYLQRKMGETEHVTKN